MQKLNINNGVIYTKIVTPSSGTSSKPCLINIVDIYKPIIIPNILKDYIPRLESTGSIVDYTNNPNTPMLGDGTYLGTVKSLVSDNMVDLYSMSNDGYFYILMIPALSIFGDMQDLSSEESITIDGAITLVNVTDSNYTNDAKSARITFDLKNYGREVYTYSETPFTGPLNLSVTGIALGGISDNSAVTDTTVLNVDGGAVMSRGTGFSQYIELGDVSDLFGVDGFYKTSEILYLSSIKPLGIGRYGYGDFKKSEVSKGTLAIPILF